MRKIMDFLAFRLILLAHYLAYEVVCSPPENRLLADLLRGYVKEERPVVDSSQPVVVKLGVSLQQIIDLNERNEQFTVNMWLTFSWKDVNLQWDPREYENVTDLRYPSDMLWRPDILLYNSVDSAFDSTYKVNMVGDSNGMITWIPPGIFTISCKLDIYYWPWDDQICFFKFGSWSFSDRYINLQPGDFDVTTYIENGEWVLMKYWVNRTEKFYDTMPNDSFPYITFFLHIRRRTLYYAFNLIMPCVLTMILVVLGFTLNPFSCEKIGLQISVSLAICIFMTIMAEMTPQTSEAVPLLGIFFQSCMVISVLATAFTVYVQSVHFRSYGGGHRMGFWMRYILLELMPWLLRIQRPKQKVNLDTLKASFRKRKEETLLSDEEKDDPEEFSKQIDHYAFLVKGTDSYLAGKLYTLNKIYNHIRTIRTANDDAAEDNEIRSEWQFGAVIVDRLCLIVFTLLIAITGTTIAVQAPYLVA